MRASAVALQACSDFLRFAFNAPKGSNKRCQKALSIINATMRRGRRAQRVGDRVRTYLTVQHSVTGWVGSAHKCRPRRRSAAQSRAHKIENHISIQNVSGCRYVGVTISTIFMSLKSFVPVSF
jgi:hypothetical protein